MALICADTAEALTTTQRASVLQQHLQGIERELLEWRETLVHERMQDLRMEVAARKEALMSSNAAPKALAPAEAVVNSAASKRLWNDEARPLKVEFADKWSPRESLRRPDEMMVMSAREAVRMSSSEAMAVHIGGDRSDVQTHVTKETRHQNIEFADMWATAPVSCSATGAPMNLGGSLPNTAPEGSPRLPGVSPRPMQTDCSVWDVQRPHLASNSNAFENRDDHELAGLAPHCIHQAGPMPLDRPLEGVPTQHRRRTIDAYSFEEAVKERVSDPLVFENTDFNPSKTRPSLRARVSHTPRSAGVDKTPSSTSGSPAAVSSEHQGVGQRSSRVGPTTSRGGCRDASVTGATRPPPSNWGDNNTAWTASSPSRPSFSRTAPQVSSPSSGTTAFGMPPARAATKPPARGAIPSQSGPSTSPTSPRPAPARADGSADHDFRKTSTAETKARCPGASNVSSSGHRPAPGPGPSTSSPRTQRADAGPHPSQSAPSPNARAQGPAGQPKTRFGFTHRASTGPRSPSPPPTCKVPDSRTHGGGETQAKGKMSLEALKAQLSRLRKVASRAERKQHFMKLCFQWHPDKNPTNVEFATKGFQMIQERRSQLLVS